MRIFGKLPKGQQLQQITKSPNYKNGAFQNLSQTIMRLSGRTYRNMIWRPAYVKPDYALPSVKTDLHQLPADVPLMVWFGHSSYLLQLEGKKILVDPVFSGNASPFSFMITAFEGTDIYKPEDMPDIDILLLTHDHYDHLDYRTLLKLRPKVGRIICPLGVRAHLEYWGFAAGIIHDVDWWDEVDVENFHFTSTPAKHFSGRGLKRGQSLWTSYVLSAGEYRIYLGGDSGYDTHFKTIGDKYGPFDLSILECGQYNDDWHSIHMMPEETAMAAADLRSKVFIPVHWAKFGLAFHPWDDPIRRVMRKANELGLRITTPMIGEPVFIGKKYPSSRWWEK